MSVFLIFLVVFLLTTSLSSFAMKQNGTKRSADDPRIKLKTLKILTLMPLTGKEPSDGRACLASMQIVLDVVNARADILPRYRLEMDVEDEARNGVAAPRAFVDFTRRHLISSSIVMSPIVIGPTSNCQNVAPALRQFYMTQFSISCSGPTMVSPVGHRRLAPNLYRLQAPAANCIAAVLALAQKVGKWRQLAILTTPSSPNEYLIAMKMHAVLTQNGVEVVHLDSGPDFSSSEMLTNLRENERARIVVLVTAQTPLCLKFLCRSYALGIRAPQYVFVAGFFCYFSPDSPYLTLPDGCTREILYEQLKITFWTGAYTSSLLVGSNNNEETALGYTMSWFEEELSKSLAYKKLPDFEQRHICHDTAMATVLALDRSESQLGEKGLSLADFARWPQEIGDVVNQSAANTDFIGLRIGRVRYSKQRLELDTEDISISQWLEGSLRNRFTVQILLEENSTYHLIPIPGSEPVWFTKTGQPPKDLSEIRHFRSAISPIVSWSIITVALAISLFQIVISTKLVVFPFLSATRSRRINGSPYELALLAIGSLLMNASAISCTFYVLLDFTDQDHGNTCLLLIYHCYFRLVFGVIGLALVNGLFTTKLFIQARGAPAVVIPQPSPTPSSTSSFTLHQDRARIYYFSKNYTNYRRRAYSQSDHNLTRIVGKIRRRVGSLQQLSQTQQQSKSKELLHRLSLKSKLLQTPLTGSLGFALLNAVILCVWLASAFHQGGLLSGLHVVSEHSPIRFDQMGDFYYEIADYRCEVSNNWYWYIAIAILHGFPLVAALLAVLSKRGFNKVQNTRMKCTTIWAINSATMYGVAIFLVFTVFARPGIFQQIRIAIIASWLVLHSAASSALAFLDAWPSNIITKGNVNDKTMVEQKNKVIPNSTPTTRRRLMHQTSIASSDSSTPPTIVITGAI